jgi:excisionase family DNA binding protein
VSPGGSLRFDGLAITGGSMTITERSRMKPEVAVEPLAYTVNETCARLRISRTKLYSEISAGEIETFQIGDRRLITDEAQRRYIARKQGQAA